MELRRERCIHQQLPCTLLLPGENTYIFKPKRVSEQVVFLHQLILSTNCHTAPLRLIAMISVSEGRETFKADMEVMSYDHTASLSAAWKLAMGRRQ